MKTPLSVLALSLIFAGSSAFAAEAAAAAEPATATTPGVTKVVQIRGMDRAPVAVEKVAPTYPRELREKGVQGFATVDMLVDSTGRVVEASLVRATNPAFADQALEAAKAWKFEPAMAQGQAITTRVQVPFQFVMPQVAALEQR